ncbi:MAG: carboxypeptidase M32 [Rhodobacterales bacterium]|nr:MAG: carboxypeptidase M32 [Rhodobacterales bacterium]
MSTYDELMRFVRQTRALEEVAGRLGWDQETQMPTGAAPQRGEEAEAMAGVLHARHTDPKLGEWLAAIDAAELDAVGQANLREIRRDYTRAAKVPADLAGEIARVTSEAQGKWAQARSANDFNAFAPVLEQVSGLIRQRAEAISDGADLYDTLLDEYEPGASGAQIQALFDSMRPRLVALKDAALDAENPPAALTGSFDEDAQMALAAKLAQRFGYDMNHGHISKAVHPFCSGSGLDVRVTTRTAAADPFNCLYSTVHEVGHACYEQHISRDHLLTPLGRGASMGVHESQSRIFENQMARSRAFTGWLFDEMQTAFGPLSTPDADAFYGAANRLHRGYIRTEADEVQYNLHVMLRFDLERALIGGKIAARDMEEAWNAKFEADFGYPVDQPSNGVLQDVHWSVGLFGYFPTYALGNVYAGCLWAAINRDVPEVEAELAKGNPTPATRWLAQNLQQYGGLYRPTDLIEKATGAAPKAEPLLDYLEAKFGALYHL